MPGPNFARGCGFENAFELWQECLSQNSQRPVPGRLLDVEIATDLASEPPSRRAAERAGIFGTFPVVRRRCREVKRCSTKLVRAAL